MTVETVRMSSKGQVVIPNVIRERLGAEEGTVFAVTNDKDTVILKKIDLPTKEELILQLRELSREYKADLQKRGFTEKDLRKK